MSGTHTARAHTHAHREHIVVRFSCLCPLTKLLYLQNMLFRLICTHTLARQGASAELGGGGRQRGISRADEATTQRPHAQPARVSLCRCRSRAGFYDLSPQVAPLAGVHTSPTFSHPRLSPRAQTPALRPRLLSPPHKRVQPKLRTLPKARRLPWRE